jgi:aromatic-L-amino-acid decarboxylase
MNVDKSSDLTPSNPNQTPDDQSTSESLDPKDWTEFRQFAHRLLDDAIDYTARIGEMPVWRGVPASVKCELQKSAPQEGENTELVYQEFRNVVLPYVYANTHPRAWGWVIGAGTAQGIAHQIWAAALNSNVFGAEQSPDYVEQQVLNWFKEKMGFPPDSSGLLLSGTSMATLTSLAIARTAMLGKHVLSGGLQEEQKRVALYCSREAHLSVEKSLAVLGMGTNSLRRIAVDEEFRIVIPELQSAISEDRKNGYLPLCVIGSAGTTNTGATDDLEQLAAICERERVWFHVDGAFGGLLKLSSSLSSIVAGLEKADSVAFDLHKWMHIPYDAACMLTRHPEHHRTTFSSTGAYVERHERGIATGIPYIGLGIETSRPFRALKVWWALKENGFNKYARAIEQNVQQARFLADLIKRDPQFRLLSANLNIVCFQFAPAGLSEAAISEMNRELLHRLHATGIAVPSYTELNGKFAIRAAITNHRTTDEDIKLLVKEIARIGSEAAAIPS